jgi:hypothetical protein
VAKISPKKLTLEDFKSESDWIGKLIQPINNHFEDIQSAVSNNITIDDNLFQEIKEIKFVNETSNLPLKFQTKFNKLPKGLYCVFCIASDGTGASAQPWATWGYSNGQIQISAITGLTSSKTYTMRFHIIYG